MRKKPNTPKDIARLARITDGNPVSNRGRDRRTTEHGFYAEKKLAKRLGGQTTAGSGNQAIKGDIRLGTIRIEAKATRHRQMALKLEWLQKINEHAVQAGVNPALAIQFVDSEGDVVHAGSWVAIPEHLFQKLVPFIESIEEDETG